MLPLRFLVFALSMLSITLSAPASAWKSRTIYQLLTDRFSRTSSDSPCPDIHTYCGGTWQGVVQHLSYIQNMGFDAIWISPVVANTPGGYHGFWAQNLYQLNSHFGTEADLINLIKECHKRGIWVMVGTVANHMGPVGYNYSSIVPFNQASHYHDCNGCPPGCNINFDFPQNQTQVEICRLAALPDLNQSNPFVATSLNAWVKMLVNKYNIDAVRIDTVPEVDKTFWTSFQKSAGAYGLGEVFDFRVDYVAGYQGPIDGLLSYPLFFTIKDVFAYKKSMYLIQNMWQQYTSNFKDMSILGTFLENHDNPRFLSLTSDYQLLRNGLLFVLMAQGIPICYYGTEQGFNGGNDPNNREPLWTSGYNQSTPIYQFLSKVIGFRKANAIWNLDHIQRYADDNFYSFTRGNRALVALSNVGSNSQQIHRTITYQPWSEGTKLCNLFWSTDCVFVKNGRIDIYLNNGECKLFSPA